MHTSSSDPQGIDTAGIDTAGIDTAGIDTAGIDTAGIDTAGIDTAGIDAAGIAAATEAIRQAALRYCRGVDRLDEALMFSAYHDDATDDHGVFVGAARDLCERVVRTHRRYASTMHCVLNHSIEVLDATHARGEIYNITYLRTVTDDGARLDTWWGRYVDSYECRTGRWAIAHRVCVHEWTESRPLADTMAVDATRFRAGSSDRNATVS